MKLELVSQAQAFDQAHAEIVLAFVLADFENGHNVRMLQPGRRFGFGLETLDDDG